MCRNAPVLLLPALELRGTPLLPTGRPARSSIEGKPLLPIEADEARVIVSQLALLLLPIGSGAAARMSLLLLPTAAAGYALAAKRVVKVGCGY